MSELKYDEQGYLIEPVGHDYDTCEVEDCAVCLALEDGWAEAQMDRDDLDEKCGF